MNKAKYRQVKEMILSSQARLADYEGIVARMSDEAHRELFASCVLSEKETLFKLRRMQDNMLQELLDS